MEPGTVAQESDVQSYIIDHGNQPSAMSEDWVCLIQGMRFTNDGRYICGYVDSSQTLIQVLDSYRTLTGTSYSHHNLAQTIKSVDDNHLQTRFMSPAARPRLFWQMNAGEPTIHYDGVPFMSIGHGTDLPCVRFGGRRKRIDQVSLPSGDVVPVDYRMKTGCEAKITIRQILRYPCAQYNEAVVQGIASVRRQRKQILDDLVQRIISGSSKAHERYHLLLPTPMAHNGHTVAEIDSPPPITQPILDEVINQLSIGVTAIAVLLERTKSFIYNTYGTEATLNPNTDTIYCLTEFDIFRQVYWLYKTGQVVDNENSFKNSINLACGVEQALSQVTPSAHKSAAGLEPMRMSSSSSSTGTGTASSDAITNVYSIIMDDTPPHHHAGSTHHLEGHAHDVQAQHLDSPGPLGQMDDHRMSSKQDAEVNSVGSPHTQGLGVVMDNSSVVNQIQMGMGGASVMSGELSQAQSLQQKVHPQHHQRQPQHQQPEHATKRSGMSFGDPLPVKDNLADLKSGVGCYNMSGNAEEDDSVTQAQTEVQNMLRIIENQTRACKNLSALHTLRRQLTELCSQFSLFLAGVTFSEFGTPPTKRMRT